MPIPVTLPPAQHAALLSSPGPARFKHFIGRAVDTETVWGLRDANGWVALADETGGSGLPVWPHPDYAVACATDEWNGRFADEIDLHEFIASWLPDMDKRGVAVAVFPTPALKGVWVKANDLKRCLNEELDKYA